MSTFGLILLWQLVVYGLLSVGGYLYFWRWRKEHFAPMKNQAAEAAEADLKRDGRNSLVTLLIWNVLLLGSYAAYEQGWTMVYLDWREHGILYLVASFFIVQFLHETYFYWTHRLFHTKRFGGYFWRFHAEHHRSRNPTPLAALSFHPVEAMVHGVFMAGFMFLLPLHWIVVFYYYFFMMLVNAAGHLGYEFWPTRLHVRPVWKFLNTPTHHNLHHLHPRYGFGLYYNFWDSVCGTNDPEYREIYDALKARSNAAVRSRTENRRRSARQPSPAVTLP